MTTTTTHPLHEAILAALERRVAARDTLDGYDRGQLKAVCRHSPNLEPRVAEVLRRDAQNAARKARRATSAEGQRPEQRPSSRKVWEAFVERGEVL